MTDPREAPLNEAARKTIMGDFDPHFSGVEDRLAMDTRLFLARYDALTVAPVGNEHPAFTKWFIANRARIEQALRAEIMPRIEETEYRIGDTARIERRVSGGAATILLSARQTATAIMDYCASRPTVDWSPTKIAEMVANTAERDTYTRPDCMFNHCPSVGLCQQDDRCRHPTDIP